MRQELWGIMGVANKKEMVWSPDQGLYEMNTCFTLNSVWVLGLFVETGSQYVALASLEYVAILLPSAGFTDMLPSPAYKYYFKCQK